MKRDQRIVAGFLSAFNHYHGATFRVTSWPDSIDRTRPAVEAIATDRSGSTIAFEHTLIEPFECKCQDDARFLRVMGTLEGAQELVKRGHDVDVTLATHAIPNGVDWDAVSRRVREQLRERIPILGQGVKVESIEDLTFSLQVTIRIEEHALGETDHVWVSRSLPLDSLKEVVHRGLSRKLPKLIAANANRRILLLEQADMAHGHSDIRIAIDELSFEVPEICKIDEVWLLVTTCWESERVVFCYELSPNLGHRRLRFS